MAVILQKGRVTSTPSIVDKVSWTRPSDWTDLPALSNGDEKIYLLYNVGEEGGNIIRLKLRGDYTVDWGDGTTPTNHTSNTDADHEFLWANAPSSSLTSQGFRQVVITITPQAGHQLTHWNLATSPYVPSGFGYNTAINPQVCRIKMAGQNFTTLASACQFYRGLEEFEFVGTAPNLTTINSMFNNSYNLKKITAFNTSAVTNFNQTFRGCSALIDVPAFDLSSATNITYMFESCASLYKVPKMTLPSTVTNLQYTFRQCYDLQEVPFNNLNHVQLFYAAFENTAIREFNFSLDSATSLRQIFNSCNLLQTVKFHNIPVGQLTDIQYVFTACKSLTYVKPFDTSNVTNFRNSLAYLKYDMDFSWIDTSNGTLFESMFEGNGSITDVSWLNITSSATNIIEMFFGCRRIQKYPSSMDLTNVTSLQSTFQNNYLMEECPTLNNTGNIVSGYKAFQNCVNLKNAPAFSGQFTTVREMFYTCYSLETIPQYDLSLITAYPNSYRFAHACYVLKRSLITTHKSQVNYANCGLSRSAIVDIFNNLQTNTDGRTIYLAGNPGAPQLTSSDLAIATGKGWTVSS